MDVNSLSAIPVQAPTVRCYHCHFKFPDSCEILDHMFDRHFKREISLLCRAPSQTGATYRSIHYGIQPSDISKGKVNFVEESLSLEVIEDKLKDVIATTDAKGNEETHTYYINPQLGNSPRRVKSPSPRNLSSEENCFVFPSPKIAKKQLGIGVNDSPILSTKSYSESLSPSHSVLSYESSNSTYLNNGSAKFLDTTVPRKNGAPPIMTNKDVPKVILNGHTVFDTPIDTTSNSQTPKAVGSNGSVPHGMSGAKESRARPTSLPVSLDSSNIGLTLSRPRSGTKDSVASGASSTSIGAFSAKSVDSFVLSEEDVSAYRETFDMLDTNNDGGITKKQLLDFLTRLGADIPESDINTMMELVDSDADEVISFDELLELMRVFHSVIDHSTTVAEEMRAAFRVFDKNNDGKITREELKTTMVELGEKLTEEEIDAMLKDADLNKDGVIDYTEFVQMMSRRFSHSLDYTENGKFSPEQVADLRIAFNLLDKDKDGTITKDELKVVMTAFHQSVTDKELDEIFAKVDLDRNGRIDFKEFLTMLEDKMKVQCEDAEMRQAFKVFDRDNNGYIDCDELKSTMDDLGVKLSNKDVDSMMKEAGVGKSKRIYYEDFVKMMYGKLPTGTKPSVQFSKEQVTEFKVSFALFDKDGDGYMCEGTTVCHAIIGTSPK
ncbi:unnamed protein product [Owenia fusiformis]|uniref:EF-hand domain-containing protein n=1 Tax=Owenia fusiformis TaxID=6347 RepID=A0A8S4N1Y6_OWEFU|nr:unnamed protein product [Owenia fusiformis]